VAATVDVDWRYRQLSQYMMASLPDSEAARISAAICGERRRLDAKGGPVEARLAALRRFLKGCGWRDGAERFADRRDARRAGRARPTVLQRGAS
jgi:hypothetical protein